MTRRPETLPESVHRGNVPRKRLPTLRPKGPVADVRDGNWVALRDAVDMLATVLPTPKAALDQIILAAMLDELPITCRLLVYERADGREEHQDRHSWPSSDARLGAQLLQARHPLAELTVTLASGNIQWADVTGDWPVQALMFSTHVDAAVLIDIFRREVPDSVARTQKPYGPHSNWEEELAPWYRQRVANAPAEGYTRPQDEAAADAVGISRDMVRNLRREFAPQHWSKPGPSKSGGSGEAK